MFCRPGMGSHHRLENIIGVILGIMENKMETTDNGLHKDFTPSMKSKSTSDPRWTASSASSSASASSASCRRGLGKLEVLGS